MVSRARHLLRTIAGWFVALGSDPELGLTRSLREVEERIPDFNRALGQARAVEALLHRQISTIKDEEERTAGKLQEALRAQHRERALSYVGVIEGLTRHRRFLKQLLTVSSRATESMLKTKDSFLADRQRAMKELLTCLDGQSKRSWQDKMTDTIESFGTASVDATRDEVLRSTSNDESFDPSWVAWPPAHGSFSPPSWEDERACLEQHPVLLCAIDRLNEQP